MISSIGLIQNVQPRSELDRFVPNPEISQKLKYMNIPVIPEDPENNSKIDEQDNEILEGDRLLFATVNSEEISTLSFYVYNTEDLFLHHDVYVFTTVLDSALVGERMVALGTFEPDIFVYDAYTTFPILPQRLFSGHTDAVTCVRSHSGRFLSCSEDRSVIEWDLATGGAKSKIDHGFSIEKFDYNDRYISVGSKSDLKINEDNIVLNSDLESIKFVGENELCVLDTDGFLHLYDVRNTEKPLFSKKMHGGSALSVDCYGGKLVTSGFDRKVNILNMKSMEIEESYNKNSAILSVAVDSEGRVFCGEEDDSISYVKIST